MIDILPQIPDYNYNLKFILAQYQDSPKLKGIIAARNAFLQDMEQAIFEVRNEMHLDAAIGVQLDILGRVFEESRNSRPDEEYRTALKVKGLTHYSGTPENIIEVVKTSGGTIADYRPFYPAGFYLWTDIIFSRDVMDAISPAGVGGLIERRLKFANGNYIGTGKGTFLTRVY